MSYNSVNHDKITDFSDARGFIERVVPWTPGAYINIHHFIDEKKPDGTYQMRGVPVQSVDEFITEVVRLTKKKEVRDPYFCTSSQSKTGTRTNKKTGKEFIVAERAAENAVELKSFFIDLDIGKVKNGKPEGYQTAEEARAGLRAFLELTELPPPNISVGSGSGGSHLYWTLEEPMRVAEWLPYAHALVAAALEAGLKFDSGCTIDAARILRIPDTLNYKSSPPNPVVLKHIDNHDFPNAQILGCLEPLKKAVTGKRKSQPDINDELSAGIEREYPAREINKIAEQCEWIKHSLETGGADNDNFLRRYAFQIATECQEPRETAWALMCNRETLSRGEFDLEFDRATKEREDGKAKPATCATIKLAGVKQCAGCKYADKGLMPQNLPGVVANPANLANGLKNGGAPTTAELQSGKGKMQLAFNILLLSGRKFTHDVFHDRRLIDGVEISDDLISDLRFYIARVSDEKKDAGKDAVYDAAMSLCKHGAFDPVADYLDGLKWDDTPRLDTWLTTYCGAANTPYHRAIGRKWLLGLVRRAHQPGCKFDYCLVLEGPQGAGKSSVANILAGGDENFSDQEIIHLSAREQQEAIQGVWVFEFGEMSKMNKTEVQTVKAFLSRKKEKARPAYGRCTVEKPRRCAFIGTTNDSKYLRDDTGDRRFWPAKTGKINLAALSRDRDQLLAEAAAMEATGEDLVIPSTLWATAVAEQEARRIRHDWEDILETVKGKGFVFQGKQAEAITNEELLGGYLGIQKSDRKGNVGNTVGRIMERLGWKSRRTKKGRAYWRFVP